MSQYLHLFLSELDPKIGRHKEKKKEGKKEKRKEEKKISNRFPLGWGKAGVAPLNSVPWFPVPGPPSQDFAINLPVLRSALQIRI